MIYGVNQLNFPKHDNNDVRICKDDKPEQEVLVLKKMLTTLDDHHLNEGNNDRIEGVKHCLEVRLMCD